MTSLPGDTPTIPDAKFPQFDVASDVSDHHFAGRNPKASSSNSAVYKKIMQEWKVLSKDLPETIFVRAYETRVDLIRAAIVGARGTPYHDGLFFFDIAFPSDYPAKPPLVHYRSLGLRINPNLYSSGKVCLSLLNTWTGKKSEKWDPKNSTILQILLSIQALVLNEKPYFNEPGYSAWSGRTYWQKKSLAYNEDVFVLNCKIILFVLRNPPKNFEPLVNQHFKEHAEFLLGACDAYRKGCMKVGSFEGDPNRVKPEQVSFKFRSLMNHIYGDLVVAMSKTGAPVEHFVEQVREEKEKKAKEKVDVAAKKKKGGVNVSEVGKNLVKKLKNIGFLGLIVKDKNVKSKEVSV
ncbi:putative ubiquitin-conjugating enzyme E2 23 [Bienertia sinuspersici]